jgi:Zn-dependent M28 family amino/carboxypeptidase
MADPQAGLEERRPRRGSVERPVNGRLYRSFALLVPAALVVAAFAVSKPSSLPAPALPPVYDGAAAFALTDELARRFPNRSPGSPGAQNATSWVSAHFTELGLQVERDQFEADVPGRGRLSLENVVAVSPGRSGQAIVVLAHRDNLGAGPGANDNASGTAALIELSRAHAAPRLAQTTGRLVLPLHTVVFLSADGGAFGGLGAARFADRSRFANRTRAAIDLTAVAGRGRPQLHLAGDGPRSPPATLIRTADARVAEYVGQSPRRPGAFEQLLDLAFPFSLYEQAPFVGRGVPAVTLSTSGERPPSPFEDVLEGLDGRRLDQLGHAAQALIASLDQGTSFEDSSSTHLELGSRMVPGWALVLVLGAALVPFLVAVVDLVARSRRRGVGLLAPTRCYLRRLTFWLAAAVFFVLLGAAGLWEDGEPRPLSPESEVAQNWPAPELLLYGLLLLAAWLVARRRLLRRGPVTPKDELGGYTAALVVLALVGVVTLLWNPFALILVLPSLHAWLWLPQLRDRPVVVRTAVLLAGFAGPVVLLGSFAIRFDLGLDAPWYVTQLAAVGYVPVAAVGLALVWAAAAAQFAALATGRYAPYPSRAERSRNPSVVRLAVAAAHETVGNAQSWRRMRARS